MSSKAKSKKIIIVIISIIAAAGICGGTIFALNNRSEDASAGSAYREYTAVKSNITVGISESGTASVTRSYISFPVSAEVEEVYVKTGSAVKSGDKIARLSADDIDEVKAQYESQIFSARLELEAAVTESKTKLAQAESTYRSSLLESSSAEHTYQLSVTKIQNDISSAEKNTADLKEQLAEYEELAASYPSDHRTYSEYEENYDAYNETYESYSDTYAGYSKIYEGYSKTYKQYEKTLKEYEDELSEIKDEYNDYLESVEDDWNLITKHRNEIEQAKTDLEETAAALKKLGLTTNSKESDAITDEAKAAIAKYESALEKYNDAEAAYGSEEKTTYITIGIVQGKYEDKISAAENKVSKHKEIMEEYADMMEEYSDMMKEYSDMMSDYSKEINKYKSEFDEYNSDYTKLYGNMDEADIAKKISSLKSEIENAEYELEKVTLNSEDSEFTARQNRDSSILGASTAQETYDQTVAQINKNISDKQDSFDKLEKEYNTLLENLGDGIYIYADCDGSVASVNISEGDTIGANQTVASIMDSSEVYISVSVSEDDISSLSVGQAASVTLSAYEGITIDGEIDTIAVEPSRTSGSISYAVSVKIYPGENITVYEGMTCEVTFLQKQVSNVVYVNVQAVKYKGNGISAVLVYDENGNVVEKEVVTGFSDGRYVEIISGLSAGDTVLAESAVRLS